MAVVSVGEERRFNRDIWKLYLLLEARMVYIQLLFQPPQLRRLGGLIETSAWDFAGLSKVFGYLSGSGSGLGLACAHDIPITASRHRALCDREGVGATKS